MRESGSISFGFTAGAKKSQRPTGHRARSHIKNVMPRNIPFPRFMKNFLRVLAFGLCGFAGTTFADDFKSQSFIGSLDTIRVHGDQFMVIRNFTQDNMGSTRGVVMVAKPPTTGAVAVLAAAIIDTTTTNPPDVINSVVIAGPADVTVTCGTMGNCFISYKKDSN
jgi:hypothetical protein